jgi:hypothetical protein
MSKDTVRSLSRWIIAIGLLALGMLLIAESAADLRLGFLALAAGRMLLAWPLWLCVLEAIRALRPSPPAAPPEAQPGPTAPVVNKAETVRHEQPRPIRVHPLVFMVMQGKGPRIGCECPSCRTFREAMGSTGIGNN